MKFTTGEEALTPAQWIYKNAEEVKRQKTNDKIRFLLGNGRAVENVEDAVNEIYDRDYPKNEGRNQVFVPEQCVPTAQLMKQFDNLEEHFQGLSLSEEDKRQRTNARDASQGEIV